MNGISLFDLSGTSLLDLNGISLLPPQILEEDSVQLSTIKASKFYNSFAEKIDRWEKSLNGVSETVDLILTVQKKWMYLESIFMASEDICKQLPRESAIFMEVRAVTYSISEGTWR